MSKSTLEVKYVLYTVACDDPYNANPKREYIVDFDEPIHDEEIEELITSFVGSDHKYSYALVEKQYHRTS
ncbi:hypothetical protein [Bacillus mojavensis]